MGKTEGEIVNDMQAVREAAERRRRWRAGKGGYAKLATGRYTADLELLADAYLDLTDPTPLTVERLVEAGFERVNDIVGLCNVVVTTLRYKNLEVQMSNSDWQIWCIGPRTDGYFHIPKSIRPRTVGELQQLLLRMEAKS